LPTSPSSRPHKFSLHNNYDTTPEFDLDQLAIVFYLHLQNKPSSPSLFPIPPRASPSKNLAASNQIANMSSDEFANMADNFAHVQSRATPFSNTNPQALWQELALQITQENMVVVIPNVVFQGLSQADLQSILQAYW